MAGTCWRFSSRLRCFWRGARSRAWPPSGPTRSCRRTFVRSTSTSTRGSAGCCRVRRRSSTWEASGLARTAGRCLAITSPTRSTCSCCCSTTRTSAISSCCWSQSRSVSSGCVALCTFVGASTCGRGRGCCWRWGLRRASGSRRSSRIRCGSTWRRFCRSRAFPPGGWYGRGAGAACSRSSSLLS